MKEDAQTRQKLRDRARPFFRVSSTVRGFSGRLRRMRLRRCPGDGDSGRKALQGVDDVRDGRYRYSLLTVAESGLRPFLLKASTRNQYGLSRSMAVRKYSFAP